MGRYDSAAFPWSWSIPLIYKEYMQQTSPIVISNQRMEGSSPWVGVWKASFKLFCLIQEKLKRYWSGIGEHECLGILLRETAKKIQNRAISWKAQADTRRGGERQWDGESIKESCCWLICRNNQFLHTKVAASHVLFSYCLRDGMRTWNQLWDGERDCSGCFKKDRYLFSFFPSAFQRWW